MGLRIAGAFLLLAPTALMACEAGEHLVFACPTSQGKHIEVCQGPTAISYAYGKSGQKPELKLSESNASFVWEHGEGVSVGIADELIFHHGSARYFISHVRNFDDPSDYEAHLTVIQQGKENLYLDCVASKIKFYPGVIKAQKREMSQGMPSL